MPRRLALIAPLFFAGCAEPDAPKPAAEPPVVRAAECRWAKQPIKIDGRTEDPAWADAQELTGFSVFWEKKAGETHTAARLMWDDDYLYFTAEMEDYDLYADVTERNGMTWLNDVFELFFKPAANKPAYYEFQVNAANTPLELYFPSRGAGGFRRFAPITKLGLESAVKRRGTLNKHDDKDGGWTVEGRIPWSGFAATGGKPQQGAKWRFALCRYDYSAYLEQPELTSSAPLTRPDFHRYEDYGELTFVK
jgi:hypothetical protein